MIPDHDTVAASGLSLTAGNVKELGVPRRPRFLEDLILIPVADGLLILGAEMQTLRGESLNWVMNRIVPQLDGTRTVSELLAAFDGLQKHILRDVLQLLNQHGLLEEGDDCISSDVERAEMDARYGSQLAFFSRYLYVTGRCASRHEAQLLLSQAAIVIVCESHLIDCLAAHFERMGIGRIVKVAIPGHSHLSTDYREIVGRAIADNGAARVIGVGSWELQELIAAICLDHQCSLFPVVPEQLSMGPIMVPRASACPVCVRLQRPSEVSATARLGGPVRALWERALLARASQHVLADITGLFGTTIYKHVERWSPTSSLEGATVSVIRLPSCPLCGRQDLPATTEFLGGHHDSMALLFHGAAALKAWNMHEPRGMFAHFGSATQRLMRSAYLRHHWASRVELTNDPILLSGSAADALSDSGVSSQLLGSVDIDRLGTLLKFSAGGQASPASDGGYHLRRFTASSGNLGAAEVFVVSSAVDGLAVGSYHYDIVSHALEMHCPNDSRPSAAAAGAEWLMAEVDEALGTDVEVSRGASAAIAVLAAVERCTTKYGERGLLYALIDAGLMCHRICLLAKRLGFLARMTWRFDDALLTHLVCSEGMELIPTALIALHPRSTQSHAVSGGNIRCKGELPGQRLLHRIEAQLQEQPCSDALVLRMIAASTPIIGSAPAPVARSNSVPSNLSDAVCLPAIVPLYEDRSLHDVIKARRSGGVDGGVALDQQRLGDLLRFAARPLQVPSIADEGLSPTIFVVTLNVVDLPVCAYQYDCKSHTLLLVRQTTRLAVQEDLLLQVDQGESAVVIFLAVPLLQWLKRFGDRGYRGVANQIGWLTDHLYLAAELGGLHYIASGGFAPAPVDCLLGLDGVNDTAYFSFVVGS